MNIGELKKKIKDADDKGEVWFQVMDTRRFATNITADVDDQGILVFWDKDSGM